MVDVDLLETLCDNVWEVIDTLKMMDDETFEASLGARRYEDLVKWRDLLSKVCNYYRDNQ